MNGGTIKPMRDWNETINMICSDEFFSKVTEETYCNAYGREKWRSLSDEQKQYVMHMMLLVTVKAFNKILKDNI